jgi:hypothetical protein
MRVLPTPEHNETEESRIAKEPCDDDSVATLQKPLY